MQHNFRLWLVFFTCVFIFQTFISSGQTLFENQEENLFIKKELNTGVKFFASPEREELRTDESLFSLEQSIRGAVFELYSNNFLFQSFRQEYWSYGLELGPFIGKGNLADSSAIENINAQSSPSGLRGKLGAAYSSRFYWDSKSYTIVSIKAWGQYDIYRLNGKGTLIDSNKIIHSYENNSSHSKLQYGFQAKAGWGFGRLNPVNYIASSQWLLEKYYPGRNFSDEEIKAVAREIGKIKHQRNIHNGHSIENETKRLINFLNSTLFLESPAGIGRDWELTEFRPRFQGSRIELGPFFNYFNREPDFIYGGYIHYENQKYCSLNLNRNLNTGITYSSYKKVDWITFEATAGWNWFPSLKHEVGFGVRYLPGMAVYTLKNPEPVRHAVIPYLEYFTQLNSKYRIESEFAFRIAQKNGFVLPGPELTFSVYRSQY